MTQVIRPAEKRDAYRIAEILVFNYRLNFYPIFRDDAFYFDEMQVKSVAEDYLADGEALQNTYVYDDGAVKGMIQISAMRSKSFLSSPFCRAPASARSF